jgi:hypothetical protein
MDNDDATRRWRGQEAALGGLLVLLGLLVLAGQALDLELGRVAWPLFVIVPGLALLGVRGQVLMSLLVRVHMSVAGQAGSLQGTTSIRGLEPVLEPIAGAVDGDDSAVVQQPVQDGRGQHVVAEHAAPFAEGLV